MPRQIDHRRLVCGAVLLALAWWPGPSEAHLRSRSVSSWQADGAEVRARLTVRSRLVTRLPAIEPLAPSLEAQLASHLEAKMRVLRGDAVCPLRRPLLVRALPAGDLVASMRFACPAGDAASSYTIEQGAFFEVLANHLHLVRFEGRGGVVQERFFTATERRHAFSSASAGGESTGALDGLLAYLELGIIHILEGWDHLAFLLGLLLLCRRLRQIAWLVTGFTVGHSLTLALAATGRVRPDMPAVEALIGFTVMVVAAEFLYLRSDRRALIRWSATAVLLAFAALSFAGFGVVDPLVFVGLALFVACYWALLHSEEQARTLAPVLTVAFGLIHGFGFANVLADIGLPQGRMLAALLAFNLGVEVGQLLVVAVVVAVAAGLGSLVAEPRRRVAMELCASALVTLGGYWLVVRSGVLS